MQLRSVCAPLAGLAVLLLSQPVRAIDGVIEINQAKALAGGLTTGDGIGFPVLISQPGSYRLTSNLDASGGMPAIDVVEIASSNVSLDLNGFEIIGPNGAGAGSCISSGSSNFVRISNGTVRNCPTHGVQAFHGTVDNVIVNEAQSYGIYVDSGRVLSSIVEGAGDGGIFVEEGVVSNSVSQSGGGSGIWVVFGIIEGSVATGATGVGLLMGSGIIRGSYSSGNTGSEIHCSSRCAIEANMLDNCGASGCISGSALQTPPSSNRCEAVVCP